MLRVALSPLLSPAVETSRLLITSIPSAVTVQSRGRRRTLTPAPWNHVVSVISPEEWYRRSLIGKRKAFNREGPMWKVTVGAVDYNVDRFSHAYRNQFVRAGVPVKKYLGSFLVIFIYFCFDFLNERLSSFFL
ncbi:hypothetical protein COOONC_21202 [Cooperia oncophora]